VEYIDGALSMAKENRDNATRKGEKKNFFLSIFSGVILKNDFTCLTLEKSLFAK
jgi:hypothetical protein